MMSLALLTELQINSRCSHKLVLQLPVAKMVMSKNTLTIQKKVEVLDMVKMNPQMGIQKLSLLSIFLVESHKFPPLSRIRSSFMSPTCWAKVSVQEKSSHCWFMEGKATCQWASIGIYKGKHLEPWWNSLLWRALPDHGFGKKGSQCKNGKKAKLRIIIAIIPNANGEKEAAVVIWKAESPRCFKGVDRSKLPVQYFSQSKG